MLTLKKISPTEIRLGGLINPSVKVNLNNYNYLLNIYFFLYQFSFYFFRKYGIYLYPYKFFLLDFKEIFYFYFITFKRFFKYLKPGLKKVRQHYSRKILFSKKKKKSLKYKITSTKYFFSLFSQEQLSFSTKTFHYLYFFLTSKKKKINNSFVVGNFKQQSFFNLLLNNLRTKNVSFLNFIRWTSYTKSQLNYYSTVGLSLKKIFKLFYSFFFKILSLGSKLNLKKFLQQFKFIFRKKNFLRYFRKFLNLSKIPSKIFLNFFSRFRKNNYNKSIKIKKNNFFNSSKIINLPKNYFKLRTLLLHSQKKKIIHRIFLASLVNFPRKINTEYFINPVLSMFFPNSVHRLDSFLIKKFSKKRRPWFRKKSDYKKFRLKIRYERRQKIRRYKLCRKFHWLPKHLLHNFFKRVYRIHSSSLLIKKKKMCFRLQKKYFTLKKIQSRNFKKMILSNNFVNTIFTQKFFKSCKNTIYKISFLRINFLLNKFSTYYSSKYPLSVFSANIVKKKLLLKFKYFFILLTKKLFLKTNIFFYFTMLHKIFYNQNIKKEFLILYKRLRRIQYFKRNYRSLHLFSFIYYTFFFKRFFLLLPYYKLLLMKKKKQKRSLYRLINIYRALFYYKRREIKGIQFLLRGTFDRHGRTRKFLYLIGSYKISPFQLPILFDTIDFATKYGVVSLKFWIIYRQ